MSSSIGEPFQLYQGSTFWRKISRCEALYATNDRALPRYATVTAQADGIHVWDLQNLHAVASYSVGKHVTFALPALTLHVTEDGRKSVISYAIVGFAPDISKEDRKRTLWIIRQRLSGPGVGTSEKTAVLLKDPPARMYGTGLDKAPLLFVSESGNLSLASAQADIRSQLDLSVKCKHLETFVFPRKSCSFIQNDTDTCSSVAVVCCSTKIGLWVLLVLLGEEIVRLGSCEVRIEKLEVGNKVLCATCSPDGLLSFIDSRGVWTMHQLALQDSSLVSTAVSEGICLRRFAFLTHKLRRPSIVSLGTSIVFLAALVEGTQDIALQIWDLAYGVPLAAQSMPVPSTLSIPRLKLTVADEGQILLTLSCDKERITAERSSIYVVPVDTRLKSNLAAALEKTVLAAEWTRPGIHKFRGDSAKIIAKFQSHLKENRPQEAEKAFLKWAESHSSKEAVLGYEFVKRIFNIILPHEPRTYSYTPRITRYILEHAVVSTIMLNGRLITTLRELGDWENAMFALTTVADISEDELMASAKFLIDRERRTENAMDVNSSEGYVPPLWTYLFACVSYSFCLAPMRLAIRKYLPDAQDIVMILEILEYWMQGGTEHEIGALLKSVAANAMMPTNLADTPPYAKIITFLQALLDASFVALLQYQPSHGLLSRILSHIEPEIAFTESLESLRGVLEPFVKAQLLKEKTSTSKESPAEWRRRRRELEQRASLDVGLYRLEELVI